MMGGLKWRMVVAVAVLLLLTGCASAQTGEPALRILFIGNSYTYYNAMPDMLAAMAERAGKSVEVKLEAPGGFNFQKHWEKGRATAVIREGGWDVVVLQNQSSEPVRDPERMMRYGKLLVAEVDQAGARKVYYQTWAYRHEGDGMHSGLVRAYGQLAEVTRGEVAPVGEAFRKVRREKPELELYADDGSHPSKLGSYVAAMVIYGTLFGDGPRGTEGEVKLSEHTRAWLEQMAGELADGSQIKD
jgi:uncharacterized protein DUF4886